jgi:tryptophan-rich sensory protein
LWSFIFFSWHLLLMAAIEIYALWGAIIVTMISFRKRDAIATLLMIPYLAWVTFASVLATWFWVLN